MPLLRTVLSMEFASAPYAEEPKKVYERLLVGGAS